MTTLALLLLACSPAPPTTQDLVLENVNVVDVEAGTLQEARTVHVRGSRILSIRSGDGLEVPANARVIEGRGRFLIPGLWDMHVHVNWKPDERLSLPLFLSHGVTGVREMGSGCTGVEPERPCLAGLLDWRARIEAGTLLGPRLVALSSPVVLHDGLLEGGAGLLVDSFVERGADFVKVMQGLSTEGYFDLVFAAEERGLPVVGHVPLQVGLREASSAGQKSIEHARDLLFDGFAGAEAWRRGTRTQAPSTDIVRQMVDRHDPARVRELAQVMVENGTWYVPTHLTRRFDALAGDPTYRNDPRSEFTPPRRWDDWNFDAENTLVEHPAPGAAAAFLDFYTTGLAATGIAFEQGVGILAGTDANDSYVFPGSSLHEELGELVKAGLPPLAALRAATLDAARFLELEDDFGSVAPGKRADLVLLRGNPLEDIAHTRGIEAVIFDGRWYGAEALEEMRDGVRAAVRELTFDADVSTGDLDRLVGTYDAPPGPLIVTREAKALYFTTGGQPKSRLRPRSATLFEFLPQSITLNFRPGPDGRAMAILCSRGDRSFEATRRP